MLNGKVVVITGAARGIGEALTRAFMKRGAKLVAMDRSWDAESALRRALVEGGHLALSCDITVDADIAAAYAQAASSFATIDVLINNAAMRQRDFYAESGSCAVLDTTDEQWERMFQVNTMGTLKMIRRFIQPMRSQRRGSIINIGANGCLTSEIEPGVSVGTHPHLLNQPYEASKASMANMGFYLAEEVRLENIAVNTVFPGATRTTGSQDMVAGRQQLGIAAPLQDPEHVVPVCLYLAGETGETTTGRAYDIMQWNALHPEASTL